MINRISITADRVITGTDTMYEDGAIVIENDEIVAVGPVEDVSTGN